MPKYYKKPKGADCWQNDGNITAAAEPWLQDAIATGRIVVDGTAVGLTQYPPPAAPIPVALTDWILEEDGGLRSLPDAVFQDLYGKQTGPPELDEPTR